MRSPPTPPNEVQRLAVLASYGVLDSASEDEFDSIAKLAATACDAPIVFVSLVAEHRQWFKASVGVGPELSETPRNVSFCGHTILGDDVMQVCDATLDPRFKDNPLVTGAENFRFYAGAPLTTIDGFNLGALCVIDRRPRRLTAAQITTLKQLAALAVRLLESRRSKDRAVVLGHMLDNSSNEIYVFDANTFKFVYANEGARRHTGYSVNELLMLTPRDLQPDLNAEAFGKAIMPLVSGEQPHVAFESVCLRKDGTRYPVEARLHLSQYEFGSAFVAVVNDISTRKRIEEQLQESRDQLRLALRGSRVGLLDFNLVDGSAYLNEEWYPITGYEFPDNRTTLAFIQEITHSEDRAGVVQEFRRALSGETAHYDVQHRMKIASGEWRWFNIRGMVVERDAHGRALRMTGTFKDISELKHAQDQLLLYHEVFHHSTNGIIISDARTSGYPILSVNPAFCATTGYGSEEILGRNCRFLQGDDRNQSDLQIVRKGLEAGRETRTLLRNYRKDGSLFWNELIVYPVCDTMGTVTHFVGIQNDVTQRKALEDALYAEKERAEVTLHSIGDGVITTDEHGRITYLNPVAENMTGWRNTDATGRVIGEIFVLIDGATSLPTQDPITRVLKENITLGLPINSVLVQRDGSQIAIEDSAAPIRDRDGNAVGAVLTFHDVTETRKMAINMSHLAQHDFLTNLPNRVLLQDRLDQAIAVAKRRHGRLALIFIDLDRFKNVNDSLGHAAGDKLLQAVAQRLTDSVRDSDTVCRQGGDEFVILLPELNEPRDAAKVAEKLLTAGTLPYQIDDHELHITLSIGVSLYPDHGTDSDTVTKHADAAMYYAKELGRNNYQFFTPAMNQRAQAKLSTEMGLRAALKRNEFVLHYQPKMNLATNEIIGAEALVRWAHPARGLVPPSEFIPMAEESGLIVPIGAWVLREACENFRVWQDAGFFAMPVAVNISAVQFRDKAFLDSVAQILEETGLEPRYLELELTESVIMHDAEAAVSVLIALKTMGVQIAIDDFGTGYSSLSYLKRFPIDTLKIDQSFVRDVAADGAIVSAIINMAKSLGEKVIAEGVETQEQVDMLRKRKCDAMQGFFFSKPLDAQGFVEFCRSHQLETTR